VSGGIGRSTVSAGEQNVHGIDEQATRSVASARGQQVRGVGKQVGVLGVGNKVGVHGVREQTTGQRHQRVSRMSTASTRNPKVQGVSAGPRHRQAAEGSRCQQTSGSANNQPVDGFGGRGRRHQRAIARSRRRQAIARFEVSMSDQPGLGVGNQEWVSTA